MVVAQIVGIFLFALGGFMVVRPDLMVHFQVWLQRVLMQAQYIPSQRTQTVIRIVGIVLALIGLLLITGIIKGSHV